MGSQFIVDPKYAVLLRHPLNPDQASIQYWVDNIASVSLGTSTSKTKLAGQYVQGTGANYIVPTACRCIVGVRPKIYETTPTANQAVLATCKVESTDLKMGDYEVLANPMDSGLGTAEIQYMDTAPWWPLMYPTYGGEQVQIYGTAQVANTVAPLMAVDLLLADTWPEGFNGSTMSWASGYGPVQSKVVGINYGGGPTATGTAAGSVATDGGITISTPKKRLIDVIATVVGTTPAASKPFGGMMQIIAGELSVNPLRFAIEPITGFLGTTTAGQKLPLTHAGPLNISLRAPSNVKSSFTLDTAVTTAGNFATQYMYLDNP